MGVISLSPRTSAPPDSIEGFESGDVAVYARSDKSNKLYRKPHGGSESEVGGGTEPVENPLSNTDTAALLNNDVETAHVIVIDQDNGEMSLWFLRGSNNDAQLLFDSNDHFSNTAGATGTVNVYWSGTRYEVENQTGNEITVQAIEGGGGSVAGSTRTNEEIEDVAAALIVGGTDIDVSYDDEADELTIAYTGSGGSLSDDSVGPGHIDPSGGSDGQVIGIVNGDPAWKDDETSSGGTTSIAEELGTNSDVVYIGDGTSGVIDVSTTTTPVQDAIDAINAAGGNGSGIIWLPVGETENSGTLSGLSRKSIIGQGVGRGVTDEHNSTLTISGGGDGIQVGSGGSGGYNDGNWVYLHNFTFKSDNQTDGRAAIRFDGSYHPRDFNIGYLRFQDWTNTDAQSNPGIVALDSNQFFSSHWLRVRFFDTHGPSIYSGGGKPYGWSVGHLAHAPRAECPAMEVESRVNMNIQMFQLGGFGTHLFTGWVNDAGALNVGTAVCEPTNGFGSGDFHQPEVWNINGDGVVSMNSMIVLNPDDYDQIYNLAGGGNNFLPKPALLQTTSVDNNIVNITGTPDLESWYYGPASDIQNDNGGSTGLVRSMATAGAGNG